MTIPDLSNTEQMARIGRLTILRKARREATHKLRDRVVSLINSIDREGSCSVGGVASFLNEITKLNAAIKKIESEK